MIDHFAPRRWHNLTFAQVAYDTKVRAILAACSAQIAMLGPPPIIWTAPGYDQQDTIATLADLTPPEATAEVWQRIDREAREREETL